MSLPGYIEARLSDHKPVCVEMRRTDIRAQAALPDRSVPKGGDQWFSLAGSLLHGAGNVQGTSPAGGDDGPGVVAIMNAAVTHVHAFQAQVKKALKPAALQQSDANDEVDAEEDVEENDGAGVEDEKVREVSGAVR